MPSVSEIENGAGTPLAGSLADAVRDISYEATLTFTNWTRAVLPLDGFVFWLQGSTFTATGMLHWQATREQNEDETTSSNAIVFTTTAELVNLNQVNVGTLVTAQVEGMIFSFYAYGMHADQAGLWHYQGDALQPAEAMQFITSASQLHAYDLIVSDSLPAWLAAATYNPVWLNPANPGITLYPSYAVPENLPPPYGVVHIEPAGLRALQVVPNFYPTPAPILDGNGVPIVDGNGQPILGPIGTGFSQLTSEQVRVTLYGLNSDRAHDFVGLIFQYSRDQDVIGLMNMPVIRDEKRTAHEAMILAQKKVIDFEISYVQQRVNNIALQLIQEAAITIIAQDGSSGVVSIGAGLLAIADNIQAGGNSQATATLLTAATNTITGGTPGGAVWLPPLISGTIRVLNRWPNTRLPVYPPAGQSFEGVATNATIGIATNSAADFSLAQGSTTWRVS